MTHLTKEKLLESIKNFSGKKVLVLGDIMLDTYSFGETSRISAEAPILIIRKTEESHAFGGAANVAANVISLGGEVSLIGVVGNDIDQKKLFELFKEKNISTDNVIIDPSRRTTVKNRIMSGRHHILRVDTEDIFPISETIEKKMESILQKEIKKSDIIVISDYAKGCVSRKLVRKIIEISRKSHKKIVADIKPKNAIFFKDVYVVTPNKEEGEKISGEKDIIRIGKKVMNSLGSNVILTQGEDGMTVFEKGKKPLLIKAHKIDMFDPCGAGDTVVAAVALSLAQDLVLSQAAAISNYAASVVVRKKGVSTVSVLELNDAVRKY